MFLHHFLGYFFLEQRTEIRDQRTENRSLFCLLQTENRDQRTEIRKQRTDLCFVYFSDVFTSFLGFFFENRGQRTEKRDQRIENREQRIEIYKN